MNANLMRCANGMSFARYSLGSSLSSSLRRPTLAHTLNARFASTRLAVPKPFAPTLARTTGAVGLGLGLFALTSASKSVYCDPVTPPAKTQALPGELPAGNASQPPPPVSSVSYYELTFGSVAGFCAGVFIKKGAKVVAFFLGGVFVLLQYFGSASMIKIDWSKMATRFENLFYSKDAAGNKKAPTVVSLYNWFVHFLTADFPPRASFLAGLALGIRIG